MPRLILALGVIIVALFAVALQRLRRRPRVVRLPPTSDDPVGDALADARAAPRFADEPGLDVTDLRWIVSVAELESVDQGGHNVALGLADEVSSFADVIEDGLEEALAEQPGIEAVHVDGREVVYVRSRLALPDIQAAAIRALLAINERPRPHRLPRYRPLPPLLTSAVADGVAATMAEHGFVGRLWMSTEPNDGEMSDRAVRGYYRITQDRLVQVVRILDDYGYHNDDGTIDGAHLRLAVEVVEIATTDVAAPIERERGCEVVTGERILSTSYGVTATVDGVRDALLTKALPRCESTMSRAAIVDRWVVGLPWSVGDRLPWEAADVAARWGFRKHARDLVRYGARRSPQAGAVAAKHRL